ncbi:hypothetical protein A6J66_010795 [Yersinia enterocolitica]|nr:hypothetical protein A6J66_010795 [Yersinia enterocolitica]
MKKLLIILIILIGSIVLVAFAAHAVGMELFELIMHKSGVSCYFKKLIKMINKFLNLGLHGSIDLNSFRSFPAVTSHQ